MTDDLRRALDALIRDCSDPRGIPWLEGALAEAAAPAVAAGRLATLSAMAARRLGREPCPGAATLATAHGPVELGHWSPGDAGRALLVLAAPPAARAERCRQLYRTGDEGERISLVRALAVLVPDDTLRGLALEAGRTNSLALFAALGQHNPYPAAVYTEPELNQLVLKSLFMELPITTLPGLAGRMNPELSRMCADYVDERRAAGRTVPRDIWTALVPCMDARGRAQAMAALADPDPAHRRNAALAILAWHPADAGLGEAVDRLLDGEAEAAVRDPVAAARGPTNP